MKQFNCTFFFIWHQYFDNFVDKQMTSHCVYFWFEEHSLFTHKIRPDCHNSTYDELFVMQNCQLFKTNEICIASGKSHSISLQRRNYPYIIISIIITFTAIITRSQWWQHCQTWNKYYSGHSKAIEKKYNWRTPGKTLIEKEMWTTDFRYSWRKMEAAAAQDKWSVVYSISQVIPMDEHTLQSCKI